MWTWNGGTGQKGTAMNLARQMLGLLLCSLVVSGGSAAALEKVVYFHNDAVGSPVAATNAQGQVLWTEAYDPYGTRVVKPASAKANQLWYTGKQEETELGLNYFGARWYEPGVGRFHGMDPVGFHDENVQSFNRFAYANNNPYRYVDPDGNIPVDTIWDAGNVVYDLGKAGVGYATGNPALVAEGLADAALDTGAMLIPYVPAGSSKLLRAAEKVAKEGKGPDFVVSEKGAVMPTSKDFNLVDAKKDGGDWFQIHNTHSDAKANGSPHTHFPKQHHKNRTRETRVTEGADLDVADNAMRSGQMRERRNIHDRGGE